MTKEELFEVTKNKPLEAHHVAPRRSPSAERCEKANETCWETKNYSVDCCCTLCNHCLECPGSDAGDVGGTK